VCLWRAYGSMSSQSAVAVVCWSGICGLGSMEMDALGSINTLPFDHKLGSPESQSDLLPDINKPPVGRLAQRFVHAVGGVAYHRGLPVGVAVEGWLDDGVPREVIGVLRMRARGSRIVKQPCLC
jgi:hypothetical protein